MRRPPEPQRPGLLRKGAWTEEEDALLRRCIDKYGAGKWRHVPQRAGLNRCRKSCRLRWLNYLSPGIKRGNFTDDEVDLIIRLHRLLGNRWSLIAGRLPGRTANDVKNYWNSHLSKQLELSSKQVGVNGDSEITFGKPQTISMNWMWSGDQLTIEARNKDVSDALVQSSPVDNQGIVAEENMISNVDGKSSVSSVPFSGLEEFTTSLGIEEIPQDRNESFFLEGFGELEDFLMDVNLWSDLWPSGCDQILF